MTLQSIDEFRAAAKSGGKPSSAVFRLATSEPADVSGKARTKRFVFSDGSVDRSGDTIDPNGWDTSNFVKNNVALWAHEAWSPPIGKAHNVATVGAKLMGDIEFADAATYPFADTVFRLIDGGFIKAVSVGFLPSDWEFTKDKDRPYGIDFKKQELLEISVCPIPCNAGALIQARSLGIDISPMREWAEKLLDEGATVVIPRSLLEETFRLAKTPRAVRAKYLSAAKAEGEDWKVGAARDLAIEESDSWDGSAAAKRMLDAAGFDGETPDAEKAAKGFLIYDAANPTLRGSYKLPFADLIGGTLKAVRGGVHAAASRLPQTDAPQSVLDAAKSALDGYEQKIAADKAIKSADIPGTCGRASDQPCGMKDPQECAVHAAPDDKSKSPPETKSGRRISSANEALLRKAMDHHESATKCIKDVLASNEPDEPEPDEPDQPGPDPDDQPVPVVVTEDQKREQRLREAKALAAQVKR